MQLSSASVTLFLAILYYTMTRLDSGAKEGNVKIFHFSLFFFKYCNLFLINARRGRLVTLKIDENTSIVLCWDGNKLLLPIH